MLPEFYVFVEITWTEETFTIKVKQFLYSLGQILRVPGG
jgi:hypothetical protein